MIVLYHCINNSIHFEECSYFYPNIWIFQGSHASDFWDFKEDFHWRRADMPFQKVYFVLVKKPLSSKIDIQCLINQLCSNTALFSSVAESSVLSSSSFSRPESEAFPWRGRLVGSLNRHRRHLSLRHLVWDIYVKGKCNSLLVLAMMMILMMMHAVGALVHPIILIIIIRISFGSGSGGGSGSAAANNRFTRTNRNWFGVLVFVTIRIIIIGVILFGLKLKLLLLLLKLQSIHHKVVMFSLPLVHCNWRVCNCYLRGQGTNTNGIIGFLVVAKRGSNILWWI